MEFDHLWSVINMEKSSANRNQLFFQLFELVMLMFSRLPFLVKEIDMFSSRFWFIFQLPYVSADTKTWDEKNQKSELGSPQTCLDEKDDERLSREEVEMVMRELKLSCSQESEKLPQQLHPSDLSRLFDEEPSLEEVKEAFDVFDENKDGFIDAGELQRVLCILGFKEGSELENCTIMIKRYDENGDGRIDFNEFVKFMENSFDAS